MSLVSMFHQRVEQGGDAPALQVKRGGEFVALSCNQLARDVRRAAVALRRLGVMPGSRVLQVSENRHEWIVADLAIYLVRAIHVPVHATLTGRQIMAQLADCEPSAVLLSTPQQAAKLADQTLAASVAVASYEPCEVKIAGRTPASFAELLETASESEGLQLEDEALVATSDDDVATILYTSGTTGEPKGVMLTHGNLESNARSSIEVFGQQPGDVRLTWLPLSHVFARTCGLYTWLATHECQLALAESRETILADCAVVRPTLLNGVPYFFDKLCRAMQEQPEELRSGFLQHVLGGRMRKCCSGGAALPEHVAQAFNAGGVELTQGYGLTETSPVITICDDPHRTGSAGRAIPGVEVRIAEDGEILTRGPHVMRGYWNKPTATAEVLKDGWLHTGDVGRLDDEGFLYITGRKKEILVTAGGKNVAPVQLESLLTEDPLIAQAMILGDGRNYLAALIVPDPAQLQTVLDERKIVCEASQWASDQAVLELFAERINSRLSGVSAYEQVGRFALLNEPFTSEGGELTPTLKLRRAIIEKKYAAQIEWLYRSPSGPTSSVQESAEP